MKIVQATLEQLSDAASLFEQYRMFYKQEPNPSGAEEFIRDRLLNKDSDIFLGYKDDVCLGFMQIYRCWDSVSMTKLVFLYDLFVVPKARKHGIAEELIDRAKRLAKDIDAGMIMLQTHDKSSNPAIPVYEHNGFEKDTEFIVYNYVLKESS